MSNQLTWSNRKLDRLPDLKTDPVDKILGRKLLRERLETALDRLPIKRYATVLKLAFGFNQQSYCYSADEIGKMFNWSRERSAAAKAIGLQMLSKKLEKHRELQK